MWRRRIPPILLVVGLAVLGVGAARPQATRAVSTNSTTIMLALDVSGSMCSTDVTPNRLSAAQSAVRQFARSQNAHTRIGLVAFSSSAARANPAGQLGPREIETLRLLARGKRIGEVADALGVSYKTVANTTSLLKKKLGARSNPELIRFSMDMGMG